MPANDPVRRTYFFSGRVQGVGFRFTAQRLAARRRVSGFVRNLDDGRVHLVAEGSPEELDGLLGDIRSAMQGKIRDVQTSEAPAMGEFKGFEIL